jgi:hypothetical protein
MIGQSGHCVTHWRANAPLPLRVRCAPYIATHARKRTVYTQAHKRTPHQRCKE